MFRSNYSNEDAALMASPAYRRMVAAREGLLKEQARGLLINWVNHLKRIQRFKSRGEETYTIIYAVNSFVNAVEDACGNDYMVIIAKKLKEKCYSLANEHGYSGSRLDLEGQTDFLLHRGLLPRIVSYCEELETILIEC